MKEWYTWVQAVGIFCKIPEGGIRSVGTAFAPLKGEGKYRKYLLLMVDLRKKR